MLHTLAIDFNIGLDSSAYTVSEDDGFVDLTIIRTQIRNLTNENTTVTVFFETADGTALGE